MTKLSRALSVLRTPLLTITLALAALSVLPVALAQDGDASGGIVLAPIIAILTAAVGLLAGVRQWLPSGTHTVLNAIVLGGAALAAALTELADKHPTASVVAIIVAVIGTIISRFKTKDGWEV